MTTAPRFTLPADLSLLTDLYQLTMAYSYWRSERADDEAVFNLFFRSLPFGGGYAVFCGLDTAIEWLERFRFSHDDLRYLETLDAPGGGQLFDPKFLDYLSRLRLSLEIFAPREGRVVFAQEPLLRVHGPLLHCQLVETALLSIINFQTLIATKAARIAQAARGKPVLEFGLRRAQGVQGSVLASRAAYIGGCIATSNVLAGKTLHIPVRGTHAHSWVMCFDGEQEAFDEYARTQPNNALFLVDTYDSLTGVQRAIESGRKLRAAGKRLLGIRLDSGDLAYLSSEARKLLDQAGFTDTQIVASNDLDEWTIEALHGQHAAIDMWGVGTRLVTAYDQPALGGVYKLVALRRRGGVWEPKLKLSEHVEKITLPGIQQVRRFSRQGAPVADMIFSLNASPERSIIDPSDPTRRRPINETEYEDLLQPCFVRGERAYPAEELATVRKRVQRELNSFHPSIRRLLHPHEYPVGLSPELHALRAHMILARRGFPTEESHVPGATRR